MHGPHDELRNVGLFVGDRQRIVRAIDAVGVNSCAIGDVVGEILDNHSVARIELSGDVRLSVGDRFRYLWRNACRNISSFRAGPGTRTFFPDIERARGTMRGQSPSRLVTELFIESELPKMLPPRGLDVLEIGCGSGAMARRLARLGYRGSYTGVDIQDRFVRDYANEFPLDVSFEQIDAHEFTPKRPIDFMISVSTLEHIPRDSDLIKRFPGFFKPGGLELHVVPSGASLVAYLWHGFRQYTPAALVDRFGPSIDIVRLGGLGSYLLHVIFITGPEMFLRRSLRSFMPDFYARLLRGALRLDAVCPICPTAYAVIRRH